MSSLRERVREGILGRRLTRAVDEDDILVMGLLLGLCRGTKGTRR